MRSLVFDSSTIITLAMNNLLWILKPLKEQFNGEFCIPLSVKKEVVNAPLRTKKFKLEALQVSRLIEERVFKVYDDSKFQEEIKVVTSLANKIFKGRKKYIHVLHEGEVGAMVLAHKLKSDALVVDERSTRVILEDPEALGDLFRRKLHTNITINHNNLKKFNENIRKINVLRSVELGVIAFELGLLNSYITRKGKVNNDMRKDLLDGFLWAVKIRGCAVSVEEINSLLAYENL